SDSLSKTVTLNAQPSANTGSFSIICKGKSATIGLTAVSGNTYSWTSKPAGFTSTLATTSVTPTTTTTYYLTQTLTATGCKNNDSVSVIVRPRPVVTFSGATTACAGSTTLYSSTDTGVSYNWKITNGSVSSGLWTKNANI